MADRHGWARDLSREIIDEGRSAFTGFNRTEGSGLWEFEERARAGRYTGGHVLIVENLDRISRQGYDAILPFLSDMTRNGVTVAVVDGERVYQAFERVELGPVIEAVVKAELAREESEKKSRRLRVAQQKKVEQAQAYASQGLHIATTKIVPAWIDVDPTTYVMELNEKRTAVLAEIFQLTIDGYGTPSIAKLLNERAEPVWNNRGRKSENGWTVGYLTKLVTNRAVLGEARPMARPRNGKATSKGVVILNRYPQAIDPVTFARAQAARQSRKRTSGAWKMTHRNLFSGIAKCGECGGRMKQETTAKKGTLRRSKPDGKYYATKQAFSYLKCNNAINRVADEVTSQPKCNNRTAIRYETLEKAVIKIATHFAVSWGKTSSVAVSKSELDLAEVQRNIDELQRQVDNLVESYSRTGSLSIERALLNREEELAALKGLHSAKQLEHDRSLATMTEPEYLEAVKKLRAELDSLETETALHARVKMKQVLGRLINQMWCDSDKRTTVMLGNNAAAITFDGKGQIVENAIFGDPVDGADAT